MLAAKVYGKKDLRLVEVESPVLSKDSTEVIVKVKAAGICGSDNHIYHGENPFATLPRVIGHEFVGEVAEIGNKVSGLEVGDHVVIEPITYCGKCYACRQGMPNVCKELEVSGVHVDGGMQEYVKVDEKQAHKIDKNVPWTTAVLAEPYTIAGNATTRGKVELGKTVLIQGAGTIGQLILRMAKAKGASVMVSDVLDSRLEFAKLNGADRVVNVLNEDLAEKLNGWTNHEGANVVIDAACTKSTFENCFEYASVAGAIVPLGMSEEASQIAQKPIMQKQLTVYGSRLQAYQFAPVIQSIEKGQLTGDGIVTHTFSINNIQDAFDLINKEPEKVRKAVILFE
ncbi:zinc-binding alcohol dehydrogenase family protein [Oceanobacillus caeni]|uniref:zinc-binding alcohol dehydrogenase family protein n=1 Tax=Oceanobacillus caeni TaxID=405946 RepID=UPI001C24BF7F|nr:zinc-binding alcohol dehydrogenase family protein [Oceanobacillus caeni]MBU8792150.1 zinc-binding alcohol dehydrogenase family protein [Oceanobacillus caeni]